LNKMHHCFFTEEETGQKFGQNIFTGTQRFDENSAVECWYNEFVKPGFD